MIDLHVHSAHSDGTLTPEAIAGLAAARGVRTLGITDHDTVAGCLPMLAAGLRHGIEVIPGVEISAVSGEHSLHLIGYGVDPESPALKDLLLTLQESRQARNRLMVERLNALGIPVRLETLKQMASGSIGRPHFARLLTLLGATRDDGEAFDRYLRRGALAYADRFRPDAGEAIAAIRSSGGLTVLAHPGSLNLSAGDLRALTADLRALGLEGIEAYHPIHNRNRVRQVIRVAEDLNLVLTGGSDYHGRDRDTSILGEYGRGRVLDDVLVQNLKNRLEEIRCANALSPGLGTA